MLNILKKVFGCNWEDELELSKVIKKNERETLTNISYIRDETKQGELIKYNINYVELITTIQIIKEYYLTCLEKMCKKRFIDPNGSILNIIEEPVEDLLGEFDINYLFGLVSDLNVDVHKIFSNYPSIRKKILNLVLYELINQFGKSNGPERALLFSKMLPESTSPEIAMKYASYDNVYDERFIRFTKEYLKLPSASESIYWAPKYFDNDPKTKYCVEELRNIINDYNEKTRDFIRRNEKQKIKQLY